MPKPYLTQVAEIMDRMNWERIRKVMIALDWKWDEAEPPTVDKMKAFATQLLDLVTDDVHPDMNLEQTYWVSSGGFTAGVTKFTDGLQWQLAFEVCCADGRVWD